MVDKEVVKDLPRLIRAFGARSAIVRLAREEGIYPLRSAVVHREQRGKESFRAKNRYVAKKLVAAAKGEED